LTARAAESPFASMRVVICLTAMLLFVRLWLAGHLELMFDEAYYALWARNLAWCYLDHPPMVALWIRLSTLLFGNNEFGVRALGALAVTAGTGIIYALSFRLFGERANAAFAASLYCSMLLIGAGAIIMTPDTPLLFFWGIALYALVRIFKHGAAGWWALVGLAVGLALQSKYSALLLGAGIVCAMIVVPRMRVWWRHPAPYLAGFLAFAIFVPVIAWNYHHGWASFTKQLGRAGTGRLTLRYVGELAVGQIGLLTPFAFVLAAGGIALALRRARDPESEARILLLAVIAPLLVYFSLHSLQERIQGNWLAPAYPVLAILGSEAAFAVASFRERGRRVIDFARHLAVPVGLGFIGITYLQALAAPLPISAARDPTALLAGWSDLATNVQAIARREGAAYVLTSSYALTSELTYYSKAPVPIVQFNQRLRWISFTRPQSTPRMQPGLYVADAGRDLSSMLSHRFAKVNKIGEIGRRRVGEQIRQYIVYRLEKPTAPTLDVDPNR
jgi:4-amino-4-deoxy-L-arabinose transferase-like glycosyltransferase